MLVLTAITAVQRFVKVWRQADKPAIPTVAPPRPSSRWATRADGVTLAARMRANRADRAQWRARFATKSRNVNAPARSIAATWRERQRPRSPR